MSSGDFPAADAPRVAARAHQAGDRIGPYRLMARLGTGGMGEVWEAFQFSLGRGVALKLLPPGNAFQRPHLMLRLRREATVLGSLDHPGIVKVLDAGEADGVSYLAMELLRGRSLAELLAHRRQVAQVPPIADDVSVLVQIAEALAAAHAVGVVHRDVKPANAMLTDTGRVVLLDFGIAEVMAAARATVSGVRSGTLAYMAPEQLAGAEVDRRTDVFALGLLAYELLTGQGAYPSSSAGERLATILAGPPRDPRRLRSDLPKDLAATVLAALSADPTHRQATAGELAADLRAIMAGVPVRWRRVSAAERLWRWARRNPWPAAAVLVLTVAGLALLVLDQVATQRLRVEAARTAASLRDVDRMAISVRLDQAEAAAAAFRVARVALVPAMNHWLREIADPLVAELPALRKARDELREQALPYDDAAAADDLRRGPFGERLARLAQEIEFRERLGEQADTASQQRLVELRKLRQEWHAQARAERTWRFADVEQQSTHDYLAAVCRRLGAFADGDASLRQRVLAQRDWALASDQRCRVEGATAWQQVAAAVAADARFAGLQLACQADLVPIGMDPLSGLPEFVHLRSGQPGAELPPRGSDGRVVPTVGMGIVLVLLPGGTFSMGAQADDPQAPNYDPAAIAMEGPVHEVTLAPFFCAKYEVTQAQWARLTAGDRPSINNSRHEERRAADGWNLHPVEGIMAVEAETVLGDQGLGLPTEAQWEYACRAGNSAPLPFPRGEVSRWANVADAAAQRAGLSLSIDADLDDGWAGHAPVGSFAANAFGLHDLHGNVGEMVRDLLASYAQPVKAGDGLRQARYDERNGASARGGSWVHRLDQTLATRRRQPGGRLLRNPTIGCRAVRAVDP